MKPLYVNKKLDEKRSIEMTTSFSTTNDIHDFLEKNTVGKMHFNPLFGDESISGQRKRKKRRRLQSRKSIEENNSKKFHELLQNLTELHVLNMSYNEMTNVLPPLNVDPTSWPNLEVIDLSSNPLTFVALTFAQAVEIRQVKVFYENVRTLTTLNWRYGEGGKNKQDSELYDKDRKSIFPASMFKQMRHGNLKSLFWYKYDVLITDESLDTLCKIGSLKCYIVQLHQNLSRPIDKYFGMLTSYTYSFVCHLIYY